ncbi:MAG TPA: PxKF domain-containing protein, partial [Actinomycetota bacterium]|nr:PxKF domain-containing protein [Actinomycetota bacterium]
TPPTVTCDQPTPVFLLNQQGAEVTAAVADEGSGPEAETVSAPTDTSSVGAKSVALTGRDLAGNETTVECSYRVEYGFAGFFDPVKNPPAINTVTAGQVVPLNFRLTDASGAPVTSLTTAKLTAVTLTCDLGTTADLPTEHVIGGLQNLVDGSYQLNWKTPRIYAGSCKTLRLDLGEGAFRTALFRFRQ